MSNDTTKDILLSRSFWGGVIAVAGPFVARYGVDLGDTEVLVSSIIALVGLALSVVGIVGRKTTISSVAGVKVNGG